MTTAASIGLIVFAICTVANLVHKLVTHDRKWSYVPAKGKVVWAMLLLWIAVFAAAILFLTGIIPAWAFLVMALSSASFQELLSIHLRRKALKGVSNPRPSFQ